MGRLKKESTETMLTLLFEYCGSLRVDSNVVNF